MTQRLDFNQIAPNGMKAIGRVHGYLMQRMNTYNRMAISFRTTPEAAKE